MWLSKDERKLLVGYCKHTGSVNKLNMVSFYRIMEFLGIWDAKPDQNDTAAADPLKKLEARFKEDLTNKEFVQALKKAKHINQLLRERGLIRIEHETGGEAAFITMAVTIKGYDLADAYQTRLGLANQYYHANKEGLLGLLWSGLAGLLGGVISHFAINAFGDSKAEPQKVEVIIQQPIPSAS